MKKFHTYFQVEAKVLECSLNDDVTYGRLPIVVISSKVRIKHILNIDFEELPVTLNVNLYEDIQNTYKIIPVSYTHLTLPTIYSV